MVAQEPALKPVGLTQALDVASITDDKVHRAARVTGEVLQHHLGQARAPDKIRSHAVSASQPSLQGAVQA